MDLQQFEMLCFLLMAIMSPCRIESSDSVDVAGLVFDLPGDKPNSGDVTNAQQQSLGTVTIDNTPGSDMKLTNNMKDMKERVEDARRNISKLQSEVENYAATATQDQSVSIAQLQSDVESVSSSGSRVQEMLSSLKTRMSSLKQTTSTGSGVEQTSPQTDQLMMENEQKKNDLNSQIPELQVQVEAALNDLTSQESDLVHLQDLVTSSGEVEERDDAQLVSSMEEHMSEAENTMDSMPGTLDSHCQILDKQIMQIQGTHVIDQGEKDLLKYSFRSASASTVYDGGDPSNVIDGSSEVYFYSTPNHCQSTQWEWGTQPWLLLTLEETFTIGGVRVLARGDCCYELTEGVRVETNPYNPEYYSNYYQLCTQTSDMLNSGSHTDLLCDFFRQAEYIKFTATVHSQLSFCEVEALGVPSTSSTYAYGQPAMQSSTFSSQTPAHLANDNDPSTCSRTLTGSDGGDPWWQVDLGKMVYLNVVTLTFKESSSYSIRDNIYVYMFSTFPTSCDVTSGDLCASTNDVATSGNFYKITCSAPHSARYIRVVKQNAFSADYLELCEVEIRAY